MIVSSRFFVTVPRSPESIEGCADRKGRSDTRSSVRVKSRSPPAEGNPTRPKGSAQARSPTASRRSTVHGADETRAASGGPTVPPPATRHYFAPPVDVSFSMTWSRPKLPGFWRGGYSLKLWSQFMT